MFLCVCIAETRHFGDVQAGAETKMMIKNKMRNSNRTNKRFSHILWESLRIFDYGESMSITSTRLQRECFIFSIVLCWWSDGMRCRRHCRRVHGISYLLFASVVVLALQIRLKCWDWLSWYRSFPYTKRRPTVELYMRNAVMKRNLQRNVSDYHGNLTKSDQPQ